MSGEKTVSAFPDGDNLFKWKATINGAAETVWFFFSIQITVELIFFSPHTQTETSVKYKSDSGHTLVNFFINF